MVGRRRLVGIYGNVHKIVIMNNKKFIFGRFYVFNGLLGYLGFVALIAIFSSCDPVKRIERAKAKWCPLCIIDSSSTTIITMRDTITYHDTIINFAAGDSVWVWGATQNCDFAPKTIKKDGYTVVVWQTNGKIGILVKDIKVSVPEHHVTTNTSTATSSSYPVYVDKKVKYIPHLYLVSSWILWVVGILGIAYFLLKNVPQGIWYQVGLIAVKFIELFQKKKQK
jgi:hypothetical protein